MFYWTKCVIHSTQLYTTTFSTKIIRYMHATLEVYNKVYACVRVCVYINRGYSYRDAILVF